MMYKSARKSRIGLAFTGITSGFLAIAFALTPSAQATGQQTDVKPKHDHHTDCTLVPADVVKLCHTVQRQRAYGWTYGPKGEGLATNPNGYVDVHDATHQGLTRGEVRDYLKGYRDQYREHVTDVSVNVDKLRPGCQYVIETIRRDGFKVTQVLTVCP